MPMATDGLIGGGLTLGGSVRPAQCRRGCCSGRGGGGCATANPARRDRGVCRRVRRQHRCRATQTAPSTPMDTPARACVSTCE